MHVLNEEEKQRASGFPFRLFLTPNIFPLPLLDKDVPEKTRKDLLNESMSLVLSNLKINHINKVDLIFIPIIKSEHVSHLVLDLKTLLFEIIDNMSTGDAQIDRYQQVPTFMRDVNFFKDDILVQAREHDGIDPKKKQWPKTISRMIKTRQSKFL
ncbi:hypothetical protein R6Q57_016642 [Mikania cordata]